MTGMDSLIFAWEPDEESSTEEREALRLPTPAGTWTFDRPQGCIGRSAARAAST